MNTLLWIVAILGVVCIALGVLFGITRYRNNDLARALREARTRINNLLLENVQLQDRIDKEIANLHAQNADLREALLEAQDKNKALEMNTIEVPEVAPLSYADAKPHVEQAAQMTPVKRPPRKPKAGQA